MSSEEIERRMGFIMEHQAKFSTDIEQLKEIQAKQAESIDKLTENVAVMQVEMREAINNLIIANEVTRNLAERQPALLLTTASVFLTWKAKAKQL